MDELRERARARLVGNLRALRDAAGFGPVPERQWWNVPAKVAAARTIYSQEKRSHPGASDAGDAMRHAEASRRVAEEVDPVTAELGGLAVEGAGLLRAASKFMLRHPAKGVFGDMMMDLHNNAEGRAAAAAGRPVDANRLQNAP